MVANRGRKATSRLSSSLSAPLNFSIVLGLACTADALSLAPVPRQASGRRTHALSLVSKFVALSSIMSDSF